MPYTIGYGIDEMYLVPGSLVRIKHFNKQPSHWADEMAHYQGMIMNVVEVLEEEGEDIQTSSDGVIENPKIFMRELRQFWWLLSDLEQAGAIYKRHHETESKDPNVLFRGVSDV